MSETLNFEIPIELIKPQNDYYLDPIKKQLIIVEETNNEIKNEVLENGEENKEIKEQKFLKKIEDNKKYMKEYCKEYYKKNKEKMDKYYAEKIHCECGMSVRKNNLSSHRLRSRHLSRVNNNKESVMEELIKMQKKFEEEIREHLKKD
jgi:hypothetical protein